MLVVVAIVRHLYNNVAVPETFACSGERVGNTVVLGFTRLDDAKPFLARRNPEARWVVAVRSIAGTNELISWSNGLVFFQE